MTIVLREARPEDAEKCGRICFDSFYSVATQHNFQPDFDSVESATDILDVMLNHDGFYAVVAERNGEIIGSNFLDERADIVGLGPITVLREAQNEGIGRRLLADALERSDGREAAGVRLVQAAYHGRSMSLYVKHGFQVREPLAVIKGPPPGVEIPGYTVRRAQTEDVEACDHLCMSVYGFTRSWELQDAISTGGALVAEVRARVMAYTTSIGFGGHTVGQTPTDIMALVAATDRIHGPGFLLPLRSKDLLTWCLEQGLRIEQPLSLMSRGTYRKPQGVFLPSIAW